MAGNAFRPYHCAMESLDCVVIGAGVVGLACARALAASGREVVILESESAFGTHTSSRNSEVIHAGIYYPKGSLKARLCVEGKQLLYRYCSEHGVEHRRCGKLIVATSAGQTAELDAIQARARANGVGDLVRITAEAARELEPEIRCIEALLSPSTGIIDSHGLMLSLLGEAEANGAMLAFNSPLLRGRIADNGVELEIGGNAPMTILARTVINSAGLYAQQVAAAIAGFPSQHIPPTYYAKGNYYSLSGRAPVSRLIYPVPEPGGLGVHITIDLAGQARFGPDVEWLDGADFDYSVDPRRADRFYAEIRKYWPGLADGSIAPAYAGIRPKLAGPKEPTNDFVIQGPQIHGVPGLINLYGIESPGLTASLATARTVAALLDT
jgi:L-2-hydroxyglutarate oxidase LhgO